MHPTAWLLLFNEDLGGSLSGYLECAYITSLSLNTARLLLGNEASAHSELAFLTNTKYFDILVGHQFYCLFQAGLCDHISPGKCIFTSQRYPPTTNSSHFR